LVAITLPDDGFSGTLRIIAMGECR
jgi:hypothetical protein